MNRTKGERGSLSPSSTDRSATIVHATTTAAASPAAAKAGPRST